MINADPGPVAQNLKTRRGQVTMVQQNMSPHVRGHIDRQGDTLIEREWPDGLRLDTVIAANGTTLTNTPEGWMTNQEILDALAQEQTTRKGITPRLIWLRRADRPDLNRPDQELAPLLSSATQVETGASSYTVKGRVGAGGGPAEGGPSIEVSVTLNLSSGLIRDYEVRVDSTRAVTRARVQVPVSDQRIVILTYLPVRQIDIPEEVREKLKAMAGRG